MRLPTGLCAVLTAALVSACTGGTSGAAPSASSATGSQASPSGTIHPSSHGAVSGAVGTSPAPVAPSSPTEAALLLEALIGQHSILASDMMRARVRADEDLAQVANSALGKNTDALGALLGPVIGAQGRQQFATLWAAHITGLFNYARGLATGDAPVRNDARSALVKYEEDLAGFFAGASRGRLDRATALTAVRMHVDHLLEAADAYAAKDYATAATMYRTSYSHTYELGATLAGALLGPEVTKALQTPALRLRAALTELLGEHVSLVVAAMRSAVGDRNDVAAMGSAVNGNTLDLTAAFDSLFGPAAARGFQSRWADHVDQLMAYTKAVVDGDAAGQEQARLKLRTFEQSFAAFLNAATQNRLGEPALTQSFVMHDRMLLAEVDAFAAKDFQQAHDLSYQTYQDMFTVSGQLATAIGATLRSRLPRGGSQTGGGGMAGVVGGR